MGKPQFLTLFMDGFLLLEACAPDSLITKMFFHLAGCNTCSVHITLRISGKEGVKII